jgi:hypothetical protein
MVARRIREATITAAIAAMIALQHRKEATNPNGDREMESNGN